MVAFGCNEDSAFGVGFVIGLICGVLMGAAIGCKATIDWEEKQIPILKQEAEKNLKIQAVKDGLAKWVVVDSSGTVKFQWIMQNAATLSESLGGQ